MAQHIFISCGELSGEIHARHLARTLRQLRPEIRLSGLGGELLRAEGVDCVADSTELRIMGFGDVAKKYFTFRRVLNDCVDHIRGNGVDTVVLVDYPGFHARLAAALRRQAPGVRIIQYICPKFWAWNYRRVRKMPYLYDQVLCILPFEKELLDREGVPGTFVGNPLLDELDFSETGAALRRDLHLAPDAKLVGIFPGSREGEIRRHAPLVARCVDRIQTAIPDVTCVVAVAPGMDADMLGRASGELWTPTVIENRAHELMAASTALLAKSGTTTLEAALFGAPMVVFYQLSWFAWQVFSMFRRVRHVSLPNLIACEFDPAQPEPVVPEFIGPEATPDACADALCAMLAAPQQRETLRRRLLELRTRLGGAGASRRAAQVILA